MILDKLDLVKKLKRIIGDYLVKDSLSSFLEELCAKWFRFLNQALKGKSKVNKYFDNNKLIIQRFDFLFKMMWSLDNDKIHKSNYLCKERNY